MPVSFTLFTYFHHDGRRLNEHPKLLKSVSEYLHTPFVFLLRAWGYCIGRSCFMPSVAEEEFSSAMMGASNDNNSHSSAHQSNNASHPQPSPGVVVMTPAMEQSLQQLQENLTCQLCKGLMRSPSTLGGCGHSFCLTCIEAYSSDYWNCPGLCLRVICYACVIEYLVHIESHASLSTSQFLSHSVQPSHNDARRCCFGCYQS